MIEPQARFGRGRRAAPRLRGTCGS